MSVILGIDPSFTASGLIFLQTPDNHHDEILIASKGSSTIERVRYVYRIINTKIEEYKPDLIVIEAFAFSRPNQAHQIGYLGLRIREEIERLNFSYIEPTPNQVKKFCSGKGNCAKELILQQVYKRWGVEFSDNNLADAYTMARLGAAYLEEDHNLTAFQQGVIDTMKGIITPKKRKAKKKKESPPSRGLQLFE